MVRVTGNWETFSSAHLLACQSALVITVFIWHFWQARLAELALFSCDFVVDVGGHSYYNF